jgi:hypothetical protein
MRNPPIRWITVGTCIVREPLFRCFRLGEFLEARIIPERIEHRIEPEQGRSERHVNSQWAFIWYREHFLQSDTARSGSPVCAATRASISIGVGPNIASFSIGNAAIAFDESERGGFLAKTHIGQCQTTNQAKIVRLFCPNKEARAVTFNSW